MSGTCKQSTGVAGDLGYGHMRSTVLPYAGSIGKHFSPMPGCTTAMCHGPGTSLQQIFKNTQYLLESRLSMSTMGLPEVFLHKTLKILGFKVLQAKIASFCILLKHQGDLSVAGAIKKKALLLCGSQVNIEKKDHSWQAGLSLKTRKC